MPAQGKANKLQVPEVSYHTFWERAVAYGLDALVVLLPLSLTRIIAYNNVSPGPLYVTLTLLTPWIWIVYRVLMHGLRGQTLGKQVLRLRVVDELEQAISLQRATLREIVPISTELIFGLLVIVNFESYVKLLDPETYLSVPYPSWLRIAGYIPATWILINAVTMLANDKRRAAHDYIARTCVYRMIGTPTPRSRKGTGSAVGPARRKAQGRRYVVGGAILFGFLGAFWIVVANSMFSTGEYQEVSAPIQVLLAGLWGAIAGWLLYRANLAYHGTGSSVSRNPVMSLFWALFVVLGSMLICGLLVVGWMGSGG